MKLSRAMLGPVVGACLLALSPATRADWALSAVEPAMVRPAPGNMEIQAQNPPSFTWARHPAKPTSYILEITGPSGVLPLVTVNRLWYLPTTRLPAGTYSWRVRPGDRVDWSTPRSFVISSNTPLFEVPDDATLKTRITSRSRPRTLPLSFPKYANWSEAQLRERGSAYTEMRKDVVWRTTAMTDVLDSEWKIFPATASAEKAAQTAAMGQRLATAGRQLESAALLYRLTGERVFLDEALRRGDALAALSPTGPTAYQYVDAGSRQIALALLKGIDMLSAEINSTDANRRARWMASVKPRVQDMYLDLSGNDDRLDRYPFDSHGGSNLGYLAVLATLSLGEVPEADVWFKFAFRAYAHAIYAWSGPEGGFANGTAYATYTADIALALWQPIQQATGINLFNKPWSVGFVNYSMQFLPPGTPLNVFGDEHELKPEMRIMKAFAARFSAPQAAWYVRNLRDVETPATLLQAPFPLPSAQAPTATAPPNAAVFPSIGWAAMHSDITSATRTSVFFKSSPYGAYNHSHGDQNSIVLFSGNQPLLIETGYEDYYGSPLASSWYRQTKAHNAVTYDGGVGQLITGNTENLTRNGKITAFSTTASVDFVEGDALAAYGTALNTAKRQVWYLRNQDAVVVRDKLGAPTARSFEWNFHAPVTIATSAAGEYSITNGGRSVCVRSLGTSPVTFKKWAGATPQAGKVEDHAAFVLPAATSGEFLVLLDVGCKRPATQLTATATGWTLKVGTQTIVIGK